MRPTLAEIARTAGVSPATVDRVVNVRGGVRPATVERVLGVARRVGYPLAGMPPGASEAEVGLQSVMLRILLPSGTNAFIDDLSQRIASEADGMAQVRASVETFALRDPGGLSRRLHALHGHADGVALVAIDHPEVREAIRGLVQSGCPVVTMVSDIHGVPRLGYVGTDNGQAGRLAGHVMARFVGARGPAKVAFFAGSLSYRGHQEREMGFRQVIAGDFPHLAIVGRHEVHEDRDRAHAEAADLLARHPDLAGIYNAGGATAGIARALRDAGRDRDVVFVAHEATAGNKALLLDGTLDAAIDQNPRVVAREALAALAGAARGLPHAIVAPRLHIVLRENLPDD